METENKTITVETTINAPIKQVWELWSGPEHIVKWNTASDDWYTPRAENDLRTGGTFVFRMEAKDGSFGFDFTGVYKDIRENEFIEYKIEDGRKVKIIFSNQGNDTKVVETFEAENTHPIEVQRSGLQSILDNFKNYTESQSD